MGAKFRVTFLAVGAVLSLSLALAFPLKASANYVESNLIDDTMFLDSASMSASSVQSFLSSRGGALANYSSWSDRDNATISAAQIIAEAAYDYGISPKVIIATLQKEQSLITAKDPAGSQYDFAMGYGCPDSSGCGATYKGFFRQVDNGAWQLRYNFERARGNNSWWRESSAYACGGATRYYSTGLYQGRTVTFYDESGYGYKTFLLNGAATASLYCYTPHAYPGSSNYYYSGSYNFVTAYEAWFGSTQPGVVIGSPLWVNAKIPGHFFTNTPVGVGFELANNTGSPIDVGGMTVAVRDSNGNNYDYPLKQMTIPAFGRATYSATQTLPHEGDYTFWISNYSGGAWKDNYPTSWSIDAPRRVVASVQAAPTISIGPNTGSTDIRQQKSATYAFAIKNNSARTLDLGKVALAVRGPGGVNADLPLKPVSLAAGASYTYSDTLKPPYYGSYTAWVTQTYDGFAWNENDFPASDTGVSRKITFNTKPSPTLTQSPTLSIASPRVDQPVDLSFKVKNFGDSQVNAGIVGLAIRDPQGRNVDAGGTTTTINGNTEYTYLAHNVQFKTPGTYTAWVTVSRDNGKTWDDTYYPVNESDTITRKITFTVLPNPTISAGPTVATTDPRVGKQLSMNFTLKNYSSAPVSPGKVAMAIRDPQGRNLDMSLQDVTIPASGTYVYSGTVPGVNMKTPGTYTAWITYTADQRSWNDTTYPYLDSNTIQRKITFEVKQSPTLTQGPQLSVASPTVNQAVNASFKIKNYSDASVDAGIVGLAIRDPQGRNVDAGGVTLTINANTEYVFNASGLKFSTPGTYTAWVTVSRDNGKTWDDTSYPTAENDMIKRKITFTVQP